MVKNGKLYGDVISPDVTVYRITDLDLGEVVELRMIALTNHPVGKYAGVSATSNDDTKRKCELNYNYPSCRPGPPLVVKFTGLVKPAIKVWTEKVSGYTAMVVFQTS